MFLMCEMGNFHTAGFQNKRFITLRTKKRLFLFHFLQNYTIRHIRKYEQLAVTHFRRQYTNHAPLDDYMRN